MRKHLSIIMAYILIIRFPLTDLNVNDLLKGKFNSVADVRFRIFLKEETSPGLSF